MQANYLLEIIEAGEGLNAEFKESRNKLNKGVFNSVCAFLNRSGGHIFLGVTDDGAIVGIDEEEVDKIKKDFVTSVNNPLKINPTFYLTVNEVNIDN